MLKNYLITYLTSCENLKLIKVGVSNPDLAMLFIPLCGRSLDSTCGSKKVKRVISSLCAPFCAWEEKLAPLPFTLWNDISRALLPSPEALVSATWLIG